MDSQNKPRILIVSTAYLPLIGGAELAVKEITDRLGEGYQFDLVCARVRAGLTPRERIGAVDVYRVGRGSHYDKYLLPWRAYRMLKSGAYHAAWVVMASYGSLLVPRAGVPYLLTLQEGDSEEHILRRVGIFYRLWRKVFERASYVQTISTYLADFARKHGAVCPIKVVPNGVDVEKFKNLQPTTYNLQPFTIITTSRLVHKNGIDILIRAMALLKANEATSYKLKARIVGSGPLEQELQSLAKHLQVDDVVEFLGEIPYGEIPAELANADIFVRPSRSEGLGTSFLEAMAAGLPIIGTRVGGIPDFLKDGETGLFLNVDDSKDLATKVRTLINDRKLRERIARNGRELVFKNYSWDSVAERMESIFKRLVTQQ